MMSLDDYEAFEESAYLLRTSKNVVRLMESRPVDLSGALAYCTITSTATNGGMP
jgi:hypothetical protein